MMKKLLNSKWTAIKPSNNEKHFEVIKVERSVENPEIIKLIVLQAVFTKQQYRMKPSKLKDLKVWKQGWH